MYAIKMNTDKSLTTTIRSTLYQYENNADTLLFLTPMEYNGYSLSDGTMKLHYILPDGVAMVEDLEMDPEPYKTYYQYRLKVTTLITSVVGKIELWLESLDTDLSVLFKSGSAFVDISPKAVVDTPIQPGQPDVEEIAELQARVEALENDKADNIIYDEDDKYLQLTSNGTPIGDKVKINLTAEGDDGGSIDYDNQNGSGGSGSNATDKDDEVIYF